ncbi:MAG: hypothetical protein ACUVV0_01325 [Anaerolineae bacterium]
MSDTPQAKVLASQQKWEYNIIHARRRLSGTGVLASLRETLAQMGEENWELVGVVESGGETFLFLKRPA